MLGAILFAGSGYQGGATLFHQLGFRWESTSGDVVFLQSCAIIHSAEPHIGEHFTIPYFNTWKGMGRWGGGPRGAANEVAKDYNQGRCELTSHFPLAAANLEN
ncbi:hypothetical protein H0W32_01610 [Patescibacteria group bacterium]|nr:hypothetical protein [Patescibacteria group bacterium]